MFPTEKASQPALLDLSKAAPAPASGKHGGQAPSREAPGEKHPRNQLNELTGQEWVYFTRSVLTTTYAFAYGHQLRKAHGANKPPELMKEFIEFFTRADEVVLDPFAGVGGTLIGASIAIRAAPGHRHRDQPALGGDLPGGYRRLCRRAHGAALAGRRLSRGLVRPGALCR